MPVMTVQHGQPLTTIDTLTGTPLSVSGGIGGTSIGIGSFTMTAAGVLTVSDTAIQANSMVVFSALNSAAGLLAATKSLWASTISAGSFVFNCSATGAGAPAGTELFGYIVLSELT